MKLNVSLILTTSILSLCDGQPWFRSDKKNNIVCASNGVTYKTSEFFVAQSIDTELHIIHEGPCLQLYSSNDDLKPKTSSEHEFYPIREPNPEKNYNNNDNDDLSDLPKPYYVKTITEREYIPTTKSPLPEIYSWQSQSRRARKWKPKPKPPPKPRYKNTTESKKPKLQWEISIEFLDSDEYKQYLKLKKKNSKGNKMLLGKNNIGKQKSKLAWWHKQSPRLPRLYPYRGEGVIQQGDS